MKNPDFDRKLLLARMSDVLDGTLDEAGAKSLQELLASSAEARRCYREQMKLHARLHLEYSGARAMKFMPGTEGAAKSRTVARPGWKFALAAAAAVLALLAVLLWPARGPQDTFATLEKARAARWGSGHLPTSEAARLGAGTLQLKEGLATIRFDSGAELSLEAPATLDLIDAMNCRLHGGTAVANVPKSAVGFRIDTPSASVIDHGTRFAVSVEPETGCMLAQVFDGEVTVRQPATGKVVALRSGQHSSVTGRDMGPATDGLAERILPGAPDIPRHGPDWLLLKSSKDAFVGPVLRTDSDILLYVKRGEPGFDRVAYLGFDLAGIAPEQIKEAELALHFAPTGLGLASHVPDATFRVFGLALPDGTWSEDDLVHHKIPASLARAAERLTGDEVRLLGSFAVEQGVQQGSFGIQGEALADFLRERAGSSITLMVARETPEFERNGLVHGIASRRHPVLPAPTLAIRPRRE